MKIVLFYEKPGCATNAKQKKYLRSVGCSVIERNLLESGLTRSELKAFFAHMPVKTWFNPNAPKVKSGEVDPSAMNETAALELLLLEPILIKRPLMVISNKKLCGFEQEKVDALLDITSQFKVQSACSSESESCDAIYINI